ncbi:hypothetical protein M0P65_05595, partial [Candidatus Gracilibacteria bacterium]|nr:hypothetical protein [Candidatus Gracilibacteria bacterium]
IWQYIKLTESEFTNDCITCPKKYLAVTQVENQEWRSSLELEKSSNYKLKLKIREAFKEAKEQKKQLIVETDSVEIPVVTIEFDVPLKGRHKNGKLYFIPLRRIKSWTIQ